jgi:shikimate dehydrogenase
MKITAATRLYGVIGSPARHSLSPVMHTGWLADHGIDAVYVAFECTPDGFETLVRGLEAGGAGGVNVTLPFKERAVALASTATAAAQAAEAANTLVFGPAGIVADNTDGAGLLLDLDSRAPGWRDVSGPVVVFGAGGAARGIAAALVAAGRTVRLVVRTLARGQQLAQAVGLSTDAVLPWDSCPQALDGAALAVNATSRGLKGRDPFGPDFAPMAPGAVVYDTVYAPRTTQFLTAARSQGRLGLDGLGMLVGQGALAFELWFGVRPDSAAGLARLAAELAP